MSTARTEGLAAQARALREGEVTAAELVRVTLDRIDATQPTVNAFRRVRAEAALAEAEEADRRLERGERLPLLGVPVAIKDDTDLAGEPTAFGCAGVFPAKSEDGEAVRRLRAAGAIVVGKTNTCELGQWPFTEGPAFGATRNPWDLGHTPGVPPAAPRRRWPPGWWPGRWARTGRVRSASPRRGRVWWASSRSVAGSPPGPTPSPSTD